MPWEQAESNKNNWFEEKHPQSAADKTFDKNHKVHEKFVGIKQNGNTEKTSKK